MTSRQIERVLWLVTGMCAVIVSAVVVQAHPLTDRVVPMPAASHKVEMYNCDVLNRAVDSVIANDVFRITRRPSLAVFGTPPTPASPPPPRPLLQWKLGGVMGGPPWRAILNGVPGHEQGVVVNPGDTLGGLRIRTIRYDTVVVHGKDTTWTLTLGR